VLPQKTDLGVMVHLQISQGSLFIKEKNILALLKTEGSIKIGPD